MTESANLGQSVTSANEEQAWMHGAHYSDEDAYNDDTDGYDRRKIKVGCPGCGRYFAALCSPHTQNIGGGWRWVGCDHRQPESDFKTRCRCGREFQFTVYTPQ